MLVVVASRFDDEASALASQWGPTDARLLVPRDLSQPGWRYYPDNPGSSTAVVQDRIVSLSDITGVLTLMSAVVPHELDHIIEEDRSYVAAEMHAFLFAWLSALQCAIVNRPANGSLSGPPWTPERWTWEAHRAGLDTTRSESLEEASLERFTIAGERILPYDGGSLDLPIRRLARAAGIDTMSVTLARGRLVHASTRPHLATPGVSDALRASLSAPSL